jgi:hypothetical protein
MNSPKQLGRRREHISLSRAFHRVSAGYGGRRTDSANCRLNRTGQLTSAPDRKAHCDEKGLGKLYRQRPQGLRLGIDLEAETLISNSGVDAYRIARRRADESSSQQRAKDWSRVAVAIARKTRKRPIVLAAMFP